MASEIIVQTIKGPSSGANANKIIVPSGQTLDASAGDIKPAAGQIVQEVFDWGNDTFSSSSSSWVATPVVSSITPKYANSIIRVFTTVNVWRSAYAGYFGVKQVNSGGNTSTPAIWGDGYFTGTGGISWDTPYQCEFVAGSTSTITMTYYLNPNGGGSWFPNNSPAFGSDVHRWSMRITEIAQ